MCLIHCRTGKGTARDTEIWEINLAQNVVVERSGLGGKQRAKLQGERYDPLRLDPPSSGLYRVAFDGAVLRVGDASATVHRQVPSGTVVEVIFGFDDPEPGEDMETPLGWTIDGVPEANQAASQPPAPPAEPPIPQPPSIPPPVIPPAPPVTPPILPTPPTSPAPGASLEDELLGDLRLLASKYIGRTGLPPELAIVAQMLASGRAIDFRQLLLTLLISRL